MGGGELYVDGLVNLHTPVAPAAAAAAAAAADTAVTTLLTNMLGGCDVTALVEFAEEEVKVLILW